MSKTTAVVSLCLFLLASTISARPAKSQALSRQKRQSDQRLAELETLLALQKYGKHRLRLDRKKGDGAGGEHTPGYGIIDFRMLGRKKKSIRFSPGELENSMKKMVVIDTVNGRKGIHETKPKAYWISATNTEIVNDDTYADNLPSAPQIGDQLPATDQLGDLKKRGDAPIFFLQNNK